MTPAGFCWSDDEATNLDILRETLQAVIGWPAYDATYS